MSDAKLKDPPEEIKRENAPPGEDGLQEFRGGDNPTTGKGSLDKDAKIQDKSSEDPFGSHGGRVEIWDDKEGLKPNRTLGDAVQKIKADGTVETTIDSKANTKVIYDRSTGKYTDGEGAEIDPAKLPPPPEKTVTGDDGKEIVTRLNYDGTMVTRYPKAATGEAGSRTVYHPQDKDGLVERREYADGKKTVDTFKDQRQVTTEYAASGEKLIPTARQTTFGEKDIRVWQKESMDPSGSRTVETEFKGNPSNETSHYSADNTLTSRTRTFKADANNQLGEAVQKQEGNKLSTTFKPPQALEDGTSVGSIEFEAGKAPVFKDDTGKPIEIAKDDPKNKELQGLLNKPLSSKTLDDGTKISLYADGRRETEYAAQDGMSVGPNAIIKQVDYPPSSELKQELIKANGTSERTLRNNTSESVAADGTVKPQGQKLDLGNGREAYITHDHNTGEAQELKFTTGELQNKSYKFGHENGDLKRIDLPSSQTPPFPEGYSLQKSKEGQWQLFNAEGQPTSGEIPGLKIKTDDAGKLAGNFEISKKGDLRYKTGDGIETVLRANGNLDVFNMNDYSWVRTKPDGQAETKYWDGYNWRAGQSQKGTDGSHTITFEGNDPNAPRSVTRIPGQPGDAEGGKLLVSFANGSTIKADWREQTQQTTGPDGKEGPVRHFDGTNYREPANIREEKGMRIITFKNDDGGGPQEVIYDKEKHETTSFYRQGDQTTAAVVRDARGFVNAVDVPPPKGAGKTTFERDRDGDITKVTMPDGTVYSRRGPEQIPGEGYRMLRERRRDQTFNPDTAPDTMGNTPKGFNHWEGVDSDGKAVEPIDLNFRVTNDGTILMDKANGQSFVISPTGARIEKEKGQARTVVDGNGTTYNLTAANDFEIHENNELAPNRISGEPLIMPDGSVHFRSNMGDVTRNSQEKSLSVIDPNTGREVMRKFDHGGAVEYGPDGLMIASADANGTKLFYSYDESNKLSRISSEANGLGNVLANVDENGVLREMTGTGNDQKPAGRRIEVHPINGTRAYFKEGATTPEEVRTLDSAAEKALADGNREVKLNDGTIMTVGKNNVITGVKNPAGESKITFGADNQIAQVDLPGGTSLKASAERKIVINPANGQFILHSTKNQSALTYGPNGLLANSVNAKGDPLFYGYGEDKKLNRISTEKNGGGDILAAAGEDGVLREMTGIGADKKPNGRKIEIDPTTGAKAYFKEGAAKPEEVRTLDNAKITATEDNGVEVQLEDGTTIVRNQHNAITAVRHPDGDSKITMGENNQIARVDLPGGTVLESSADHKIELNPSTGQFTIKNTKDLSEAIYGADGTPRAFRWNASTDAKAPEIRSLMLRPTGKPDKDGEIPVEFAMLMNGKEPSLGTGSLNKGVGPAQTRLRFTTPDKRTANLYGNGELTATLPDGSSIRVDRTGKRIEEKPAGQ